MDVEVHLSPSASYRVMMVCTVLNDRVSQKDCHLCRVAYEKQLFLEVERHAANRPTSRNLVTLKLTLYPRECKR